MNLQAHQKHEWSNNLSNTNGVTKSPTVPSGSQGAVAQLDDTGRGLSGNIRHPEGCLWKNNNNNNYTVSQQVYDQGSYAKPHATGVYYV